MAGQKKIFEEILKTKIKYLQKIKKENLNIKNLIEIYKR